VTVHRGLLSLEVAVMDSSTYSGNKHFFSRPRGKRLITQLWKHRGPDHSE